MSQVIQHEISLDVAQNHYYVAIVFVVRASGYLVLGLSLEAILMPCTKRYRQIQVIINSKNQLIERLDKHRYEIGNSA